MRQEWFTGGLLAGWLLALVVGCAGGSQPDPQMPGVDVGSHITVYHDLARHVTCWVYDKATVLNSSPPSMDCLADKDFE